MKKLPSIFRQKKTWTTLVVIALVLIALGLITLSSLKKTDAKTTANKPGKTISTDVAKKTAEDFINNFLMQGGSKATIKDVTTEYGLYKMSVDITSDVVESYMTKDGKLFFPQALNVAEVTAAKNGTGAADASGSAAAPSATVTKKSDVPVVELFVMSYCPYGTQIEKGMLPVLAALGNKINFELKFCSYAMHGEKELKENLLQYCIQKEQNAKFEPYLKCFLENSDSASCLASTGVNAAAANQCATKTDTQFKVMANFTNKIGYQGSYPGFDVEKADNTKYSVGGSPTLIINGEDIQSGRDSASLLKTICSAFNNAPKECSTVLSSDAPAPGFGTATAPASAGSAAAGCGQ